MRETYTNRWFSRFDQHELSLCFLQSGLQAAQNAVLVLLPSADLAMAWSGLRCFPRSL
jgi:hypothetical protein